ncbi:MAG: YegS/Rv2252/BmrU family lipid kinase [Chitinophagaceae bacterium]|nr:YegS/Rv2252/BmrU family lipid kinase [Chitinophagaceae bacterium]
MRRHIIYIINPIAGTRAKKDLQAFIAQQTSQQGIGYDIFPSVANADYSFLHTIIREKKATDIVIAGGDGTVSQVVSGLMDHDLRFGIIPCGSGNGLAFTARIPKDPGKALDVIFKGHAALTDGFYINDKFAVHLCGLGFDAKVAHDFAQQPKRGLATYVKQVIRNFFAAKYYLFELQVTGHSFVTDAFFISVANSNQFGNNFTIAPKASLSDGLLDIVIVTHQNKLNLLLQTFKQVSGRIPLEAGAIETGKKGVVYFQADTLTIINKENAPLHIDGDPAETAERFAITVKKNCFRLLQPA